jgi:hypothetical protein
MIQQPQAEQSESEKRLNNINSALNTITNLQTQLNGMSSQLSMILGNLGQLAGGLQDNIQWLITQGDDKDRSIIELNGKISSLEPKEETEKPQPKKRKTEKL